MPPHTPIYKGRVVDFGIEAIEQPDGRVMDMEIARHPGGAAAVALDAAGRVCILRQFRGPLNEWLWELPAGKIDHGEEPLTTAQRELEEEAGVRACRWYSLGSIVTCPGFCDEVLHLYLATDLEDVGSQTQDDEYIEVHWLPFGEALEKAYSGDLQDVKTLVGLFRAARADLAKP